MFLGLLIFKNGPGPAERGSDEMDPSIFFSGNEQTKAEGAGYFHIFETAWIYWVGVAPQKCLSAVGATGS